MIRSVIFDMDGVLLDNVEFHLEAFRRFGEEQGTVLTRDDVYRVFGRKNEDMMVALLNRSLSDAEITSYETRKEEIYRELIRPSLAQHLVDGLWRFLGELRQSEIPLAVATSGPADNVNMVMDELDLRTYFSVIVSGEQVVRGKPHPEAFLTAAARLGYAPESCAVFEDSVSGVRAALTAGCQCIALTTTHRRDELLALSPRRVIDDFTEFTLVDLRQL